MKDLQKAEAPLLKSTLIIFIGILITRVFAYLKILFIANSFGASILPDIYFATSIFIYIAFALFISGNISYGFITIFSEYFNEGKNNEKCWQFISSSINVVFLTLFAIAIIGILTAP